MSSARHEAAFPWLKHYPPGIAWNQSFRARPAYEMLYDAAAAYGNRPAFDFLGRKWTWAQTAQFADRLAKGLQAQGIGKGVKVGLFLPNSYYFLVAYYAILRTGATVVNFNPLYAPRELQNQIEDSETDYMVTLDLQALYGKMHDMLAATRLKRLIVCRFADMLPFPKNILFPLVKKKDAALIPAEDNCLWYHNLIANDGKPQTVTIDPDNDVAVLQYTGGTTGVPKGAMLTHTNIVANTEQGTAWFTGLRPGQDKVLGILPFFHVFAMTVVMNMSVRSGLEIIALPRFDLDEALKTIHRKRPQFIPGVPAIFNAINNHPRLKQFDLSSLERGIVGGAPAPAEVKRAFEANTGCIVVEGYGLSEASPVVSVNPLHGQSRQLSIGLPLPATVVEIISTADGRVLPPGERGELCVRGPQVMKGYWKKPEETALVLKNGRLHTGDVAIMDEDGYFYIVDRIKDMIITNGYNVYPRNVEDAIYLHPGVEECIVAGIPDESRGEAVKAWIKMKAGQKMTAEELKTFLKDKISPMEIPRHFEFRDQPLPKTMVGKLSRKDVLAQEKNKSG